VNQPTRTVRELSGELFAELSESVTRGEAPSEVIEADRHGVLVAWVTDIVLGTLARYEGFLIVNDNDLPVTPLPRRWPPPEGLE
jgi:hypothetical protein